MSNETNETPVQGRKVGIARFFELLGRDLWPLYKSGILCVLGFLPGTALAVFGMMAGSALLTVVGGVVGGLVGGPFLSGMIDTVLRALRDEPGYWWNTYKRAWKQNWRQSLVPGALLGLFVGSWAWMLRAQAESGNTSTALWVASFAGIFVCTGFFTWLLAQVPLVDLPLAQIAKNAGLMFFGFFPRTAAAALVLALYFDFSGYTDMALGVGKLLGFDLAENFRWPLAARTLTDFWRRWHITLGWWFRDHLYRPLVRAAGGKRTGCLLLVWLLVGLWHGAGWNFLLWGLLFGLLLAAERLGLGGWLNRFPPLGHLFVLAVLGFGAVLLDWGGPGPEPGAVGGLAGPGGTGGNGDRGVVCPEKLWPTLLLAALGATPGPAVGWPASVGGPGRARWWRWRNRWCWRPCL